MEKNVPLADVQANEKVGQSSSPYREIELSEAQNAFQDIVDFIGSHENCSRVPKEDLTKQIQLIANEIVKSKIRDKLLLSSKKDLNTKFAEMKINNSKQKEKPESELLKLKYQVVAQTNSISNQAKYMNTLIEKSEKVECENEALKSKVENLNQEVTNLNQEVKNLNQEVKNLKKEVETSKSENEKLGEKNSELLAQINTMLQ